MASLPPMFINISEIYRRLDALEHCVDKLEFCVEKLSEMCGNTNSVLKQLVEVHRNGIKEEVNKGSKAETVVQIEQQMEGLQKEKVRRPRRKRLHNSEAAD